MRVAILAAFHPDGVITRKIVLRPQCSSDTATKYGLIIQIICRCGGVRLLLHMSQYIVFTASRSNCTSCVERILRALWGMGARSNLTLPDLPTISYPDRVDVSRDIPSRYVSRITKERM